MGLPAAVAARSGAPTVPRRAVAAGAARAPGCSAARAEARGRGRGDQDSRARRFGSAHRAVSRQHWRETARRSRLPGPIGPGGGGAAARSACGASHGAHPPTLRRRCASRIAGTGTAGFPGKAPSFPCPSQMGRPGSVPELSHRVSFIGARFPRVRSAREVGRRPRERGPRFRAEAPSPCGSRPCGLQSLTRDAERLALVTPAGRSGPTGLAAAAPPRGAPFGARCHAHPPTLRRRCAPRRAPALPPPGRTMLAPGPASRHGWRSAARSRSAPCGNHSRRKPPVSPPGKAGAERCSTGPSRLTNQYPARLSPALRSGCPDLSRTSAPAAGRTVLGLVATVTATPQACR